MRLAGKVAIVTGGARHIGAAYACKLSGEGAAVVIADVLDGEQVANQIQRAGGKALALKVDVSSEEDTMRMAAETVKIFGRIDILVNNAAIFIALNRRPFYEISAEEWDRVSAVNIKGPFLCAKAVIDGLLRHSVVSALRRIQGGTGWNHAFPSAGGRRVRYLCECDCAWFGPTRRAECAQRVH